MRQPPRYGIWAFLIATVGVALIVVGLFSGGSSALKGVDDIGQRSEDRRVSKVLKSYACPRCGWRRDWGSETCPRCGWSRDRLMHQAALPGAPAGLGPTKRPPAEAGRPARGTEANAARKERAAARLRASALPSPREQNAAGKEFIEGHWLGLEVITLTPELAKEYGVPKGETGVLVDEITLEAAESGILAGDMVRSIDGRPTPDLRAFFLATQRVRDKGQARVGISRRGSKMTFVIEARNTKELGFAQMEAAQPIRPGSISPHRSRGRPCTDCHIIMQTGGQLPTDAGDILPNPPPIAGDARPPHGNRGRCSVCHVMR